MQIYVQPRIGTSVVGARMPIDGPIMEADPTFSSLRALYPDPNVLLRLDIQALREELPVWGDLRIGGRDLFTLWSDDATLPGYDVGLLTFALDLCWVLDEAVRNGETDFDPHEAGAVLDVKSDGDLLTIHSQDMQETFRVARGDAWNAVHGLSGRVRAFLLSMDQRFAIHPEIGPWIRGEETIVDTFKLPKFPLRFPY